MKTKRSRPSAPALEAATRGCEGISAPGALTSKSGASAPRVTRNLKPMMYDSSDRGLASMTRAAAMAVALCLSALAPALAADQPPTPAPAMPPSAPKGEFNDSCAMGLASGQVVKTDCSVNWTDARRQGLLLLYGSLESDLPQGPGREHPEGEGVLRRTGQYGSLHFRSVRRGRREALQGIHRGGRQQAGRGGDRRALQGRRLRVSRPQARCRPQPGL